MVTRQSTSTNSKPTVSGQRLPHRGSSARRRLPRARRHAPAARSPMSTPWSGRHLSPLSEQPHARIEDRVEHVHDRLISTNEAAIRKMIPVATW